VILIDVDVKESNVHGMGLFAKHDVPKGTELWAFGEADSRIPVSEATDEVMHYGYINPENPNFVVVCGDVSRFWNFGLNGSNSGPSRKKRGGESVIVALLDIKSGEELLISTESDFDALRKLRGNIQPV
jgi:SET domain-containing protein